MSNKKKVRKTKKIKGRGLPTLLTKGSFSFHDNVKIPETYKNSLLNDNAVDIIMKILTEKLNESGVMNRLYFLNARTGSGKSTIFVSSLYNAFIRNHRSRLYVTEPRVPLCSSNASEIIRWKQYQDDQLGKNVGYLTGPLKIKCYSSNGILYYCTPQIIANLLNNMLTEQNINSNNYIKIVVIDESHLLDMPTLQTLNIIFNVLEKFGNNKLCPLFIFASATLNLEPFINYYYPLMSKDNKTLTINNIYEDYKMIGYVSGLTNFDVKLHYLSKNIKIVKSDTVINNFGYCVANEVIRYYLGKILNDIPKEENGNDLLIFIPKMVLANSIADNLYNLIEKTKYDNSNVPVFSIKKGMAFSEVENWRSQNRNKKRILLVSYARGFAKASDEILKTALEPDNEAREWERKIFISTPIIETGKTISSLRYCFDIGLELKPAFNPLIYNFYSKYNLRIFPINQSSATQRLGRVGREQCGECLRLYTNETYNMLDKSELPETVNNFCLSQVVLSKLQTLPLYEYYDIINDNNYLFKISFDIQLRTICDLINSGFYNIFGLVTDTITTMKNVDSLMLYIQQLYYINGYSLFNSLLIVNMNYKFISPEITPLNLPIDNLPYKLSKLKDITPDIDIVEAIKKSRNTITLILYDQSFTLLKLLYNRLFDDITTD